MNNNPNKPTFEVFSDASRFFVDTKDENGETKKKMVVLRKACVVISITNAKGEVDKVAFMKTNRGQNYRDSRGRKCVKKHDNGDTEIVIRPLMIGENEVKSELERMLDDRYEAERAFQALQV
jgi:hypothetical protein